MILIAGCNNLANAFNNTLIPRIDKTAYWIDDDSAAELSRCDSIRHWRDVFVGVGAGAGIAAGAGGLTSLGYTEASSKRHIGELSLSVAVVGAILVSMSTSLGNAYAEEGCGDRFNLIRDKIRKAAADKAVTDKAAADKAAADKAAADKAAADKAAADKAAADKAAADKAAADKAAADKAAAPPR